MSSHRPVSFFSRLSPASPSSVFPSSTSLRCDTTRRAPRRTTGATPAESQETPASPITKPRDNSHPLLGACTMKRCPWVNALIRPALTFLMFGPYWWLISAPKDNEIHPRSFYCCGIFTSGSHKCEMNLQIIEPWILTSFGFVSPFIWPWAKLAASSVSVFLAAASCGWINPALLSHRQLREGFLSLPLKHQQRQRGLSFSADGKNRRFHFLPFGRHFWTERTIRPVCRWQSKD